MQRLVLAAALAALCVALPLNEPSTTLSTVDDLETQALIALKKNDAPGAFKNFLPLVNHVVVYAGVVLPSVKAHKENKHTNEITGSMLVQTVASAAGETAQEIEKYLPTGESMLDAMIAIGNVVGGSSGFNPIQMMSNIVGKKDLEASIDEVMHFPLRFPDPTEKEIELAEQVVLSIGLGFGDQDTAIQHFMDGLSKDKKDMIESLQKNVIERLVNAMMLPNGDPTPALIEEIKSEMREMEKRKGNTDMMPDELKQLVKDHAEKTAERAQIEGLISISQTAVQGKFKNLFPLLSQAVVVSGVVYPSLRAHKEHKHNKELSANFLVQTLNDATSRNASLEEVPTAEEMLDAMMDVGNLIGSVSGFNPIQLMTNVVGKKDMEGVVSELLHFTTEFPDPTPAEIAAAEEVALSIGLGFGNQEQSVQHFIETLSTEKKEMIERMQKNVLEKMLHAMVGPDNEPTPALVQELSRQMKEIEKHGFDELVPTEFKDILKEITANKMPKRSLEEEAQSQALVAVQGATTPTVFRNFLPMVNQAVVYTSAVLPTAKAGKKHNVDKLKDNLLVQTIAMPGTPSELEKELPTADDLLSAMVAIGKVMGGSSGFNAVEMLQNVIGKEEMSSVIDQIMKFPLRFPDPTETDIEAAEQVVITVGLGFGDQDAALDNFIKKIDPTKREMIESLEKNVMEKVINAIVQPNGDPTPALVEEVKRQMREMEKLKGNTDMMPDEIKDLIKPTKVNAEVQALIAIEGTTSKTHFKDFLPLIGHVVTYTGVVLPGVVAARKHKHNADLGGMMLVQTVSQAAGTHQEADWEKMLPTSEDMVTAMIAIGNVMGSGSGFNPVKMAVALVGKDDMVKLIDTIMKFPFRFPDLEDKQIAAAEQVLLSMALGFGDQESSINNFFDTLNSEQKQLLTDLQKNVFEKLMSVMETASGEPTPALIEEIKAEMKTMQDKNGNTDMMPDDFKQMVADSEKKTQ